MIKEKNDKQIFLSHAWGMDSQDRDNHLRCKEIYKLLLQYGYTVWFDEKDIKGNIDSSIMKGINNSKIILLCLTEKYCNKINSAINNNLPNDNCYKEWSYSLFKQKLIIPIIMEPNMQDIYTQGDGIIQMYLHNTLYIDLSDELLVNLNKLITSLDYYNIYSKNSPNITPNNSNNSLSNYFLQNLSPKKKNNFNITPNNSNNSLSNLCIKETENKQTERNSSPSSINSFREEQFISKEKFINEEKFINKISDKLTLPMNKKKSFKIISNEKKNKKIKMIYNMFFKFRKLNSNKIRI